MEELKCFEKDRKINELKRENEELKETIINMSKYMFLRNNALEEIIKKIEKELEIISKRK